MNSRPRWHYALRAACYALHAIRDALLLPFFAMICREDCLPPPLYAASLVTLHAIRACRSADSLRHAAIAAAADAMFILPLIATRRCYAITVSRRVYAIETTTTYLMLLDFSRRHV